MESPDSVFAMQVHHLSLIFVNILFGSYFGV